jgi:hypothetical protein
MSCGAAGSPRRAARERSGAPRAHRDKTRVQKQGRKNEARRATAPRKMSLERGKTGERPPTIGPTGAPRVRQAESMLIFDKRSHCAA